VERIYIDIDIDIDIDIATNYWLAVGTLFLAINLCIKILR